jgi:hypothetical protein
MNTPTSTTRRKGDRLTAEHEAAHAVMAVLCGHVVWRVTISPPKGYGDRDPFYGPGCLGLCEEHAPGDPLHPVPLSPTADIMIRAAGMAWECSTTMHELVRRDPWPGTPDQGSYTWDDWLDAIDDAQRVLRDSQVEAAVHAIADALEARKSGTVWGTTVEKLTHAAGLLKRTTCLRCLGLRKAVHVATGRLGPCLTCNGAGTVLALADDEDASLRPLRGVA